MPVGVGQIPPLPGSLRARSIRLRRPTHHRLRHLFLIYITGLCLITGLCFGACTGQVVGAASDSKDGSLVDASPGRDLQYVGPRRPQCTGREATITGTVFAPNGIDPVPGATIFVPSEIPELFAQGVRCEVCGTIGNGTANWWTTTSAADGTFSLEGVCPGKRQLVFQNGRFRRLLHITVDDNQTVQLTAEQSRLPRQAAEFNHIDAVPRIAVATGDYDKMECVLRRMGLADEAFDLYHATALYGDPHKPKPPPFIDLVNDLEKMKTYNIIFINCTDNTYEDQLRLQTVRNNIDAYVRSGGRLYVTDWSYDWIEQITSMSDFIDFEPGLSASGPEPFDWASIGAGGLDLRATIKDTGLNQWLQNFPGTVTTGKARIQHFARGWAVMHSIGEETKLWVEGPVSSELGGISNELRPLTVSFNFENCGKIVFSSYHTEGRDEFDRKVDYPDYCDANASPQDRILEYLIFDIANCIRPIE